MLTPKQNMAIDSVNISQLKNRLIHKYNIYGINVLIDELNLLKSVKVSSVFAPGLSIKHAITVYKTAINYFKSDVFRIKEMQKDLKYFSTLAKRINNSSNICHNKSNFNTAKYNGSYNEV